jgi:PKD repeat protein
VSDEIINFYKKVKEEPEEPIKEQKEEPAPVLPQPDEPFDKFLLELAEKLKTEKVITEKQQEVFVEQVRQPVSEDTNDPFKKFLESFASNLKEDKIVNREENIKEATINFINKLKEQPAEPFIIKDQPLVRTKKKDYLPQKFAKKLPEPAIEEPVEEELIEPVETLEPQTSNKYVQELQATDKVSKKQIPEKIKKLSDIKAVVTEQVTEQFNKLRQMYPNFMPHGGGGGGTNAVQYALGGTMDGDLNVTGKYLSGGIDIGTLFGSGGGGGAADRLISGSQSLILNPDGTVSFPNNFIVPPDGEILNIESETNTSELSGFTRISLSPFGFFAYDNNNNSISFSSADDTIVLASKDEYEWKFNSLGVLEGPNNTLTVNGLSSLGKILSGDRDLADIFLTSETDSQTLSWNATGYELSISNGNTISLSSLSAAPSLGREDVNTLVIENSGTWNEAYNIGTAYQSISSTFLTSETDSQTLTFTESSAELSISNGNTVSLTSINTTFATNSGKYESVYTTVQTSSGSWNKNYIYVSTNTNLSLNYKYAIDTLSGSLTATLPANPNFGDEIEVFDVRGAWSTNNLVLDNNGNYIEQRLDTLGCNVRFGIIKLIYTDNNIGWRIIPFPRHDVLPILAPDVSIQVNALSGLTPLTVNFTGVNNLGEEIAPVNTWTWNVTGGNTPQFTTQNTTFTYQTSGTFTVNLTAANSIGTDTASITISATSFPIPLSGLLVRFNADSGIAQSGGNITSWTDQQNSVVATAFNGPSLLTNEFNGRNAVSFDGVNDHFTFSLPSTLLNTSPRTIIVIGKYTNPVSRFQEGMLNSIAPASDRAYVFKNSLTRNAFFFTGGDQFGAVQFTANAYMIQSIVHRTNGTGFIRVNGVAGTDTTANSTISLNNFVIGARSTSSERFLGTIVELLIYDRELSIQEIQQLEAYANIP